MVNCSAAVEQKNKRKQKRTRTTNHSTVAEQQTKKTRTTDNSSIRTFPANFVKLIIFFSVIPINLMLHTMSSSETTFSIHSASIYYEVQGCDCLVEGILFEIKENTIMSVDNDPPSPSFTAVSAIGFFGFIHHLQHIVRRQKLSFFNVHRLATSRHSNNKIGLAA